EVMLAVFEAPPPLTPSFADLERWWREQIKNLHNLRLVADLRGDETQAMALRALRCHVIAWGWRLGMEALDRRWKLCDPP
ncbi:MAG: hypothetical protein R3F43_05605, partial [bacterium]